MTKREIEKRLRNAGFQKRPGKKHHIGVKKGSPPIPVPRHKGDIPIGTAKSILKTAGLEDEK
jgi:predicted RNA binding protein YcfA (HicA-like mRNA interferase family)